MKKVILWYAMLWYVLIYYLLYIVYNLSWELFFKDLAEGFRDSLNYYEFSLLGVSIVIIGMLILNCYIVKKGLDIKIIVNIMQRSKKYSLYNIVKKYKLWLWGGVIGLFISCCVGFSYKDNREDKIWENYTTIAHAGGIIDGHNYSNCEDAILRNYEKGHRVFEIDLLMTSDEKVVGKHKWEESFQQGLEPGEIPTEEEFLEAPLWGKYTPLSFGKLCELMNEYDDIWIVTDTKSQDKEYNKKIFNSMLKTAQELGMVHVFDRLVVQLYQTDMQEVVSKIYPFKSYIFTLYKTGFSGNKDEFLEYVRYSYANNIDAITMWEYLFVPEFAEIADRYGVGVYVHTLNDRNEANIALENGVDGVYTDSLTPDILEGE